MHPKNDKFLVWAQLHYGWVVEQLRGLDAGELVLIVHWFVLDRYVRSKKPTYAYEIAWVFQRDRGTIGNVLERLEAEGDVVRANSTLGDRRIFYLPKWGDVESWFKSTESGETDDLLSFRKKVHDENCPCMKLVGRW